MKVFVLMNGSTELEYLGEFSATLMESELEQAQILAEVRYGDGFTALVPDFVLRRWTEQYNEICQGSAAP